MDSVALAAENAGLKRSLAESEQKISALVEKLEQLAFELAKLKRQVVGPKAERPSPEASERQLSLLSSLQPEEPAEPPSPPSPPPPAPRTPHGRRAAEGTPDEIVQVPPPSACPDCGGALRTVSTSTATRLDWRRGHFVRIEVRRPSCACDRCRTVSTVPEPSTFALSRSVAGNGLLAQIVVDKFADNVPLNRQSTRFAREGLDLSTSTLADLVKRTGGLLSRIVDAMRVDLLGATWIQADDTGLPVLDGDAGKTVTGRLWAYTNDRHVVYDFTPTKHGSGPAAFITGFCGVLLADGGSEFNEAVRQKGLIRAGCWSHARRYFIEARDASPTLADEAVARIGVLFEIERRIRDADLETRRRTRDIETRAILDELQAWMVARVHGLRPSSPIAKALRYALNQWEPLTVCVAHPEIPIHNNRSELQLRRPVIGRKNWLFAGSEGGARTAAILFSLTGSCRLHEIDPWAYLVDVLGRINDHPVNRVGELAPAAWAGK